MKTTERLLEATKKLWADYNKHPFVCGIQEGTLDKEKFKYYIIQDYLYLIEYTKVFAIGIAKAKSVEVMQLFSSYVHLLADSEMDIHKGYMGIFGVTQEELDNTHVALDNLSYTSYMLRIAYEEGEAEILTAILSCAYSYEVIARNIASNNPSAINHPFYGSWVQGYASDAYHDENMILMDTLDKLTKDYTEKQLEHLKDIFINCSRYEMGFWDLAWKMKK